jgi:hypothetical protein
MVLCSAHYVFVSVFVVIQFLSPVCVIQFQFLLSFSFCVIQFINELLCLIASLGMTISYIIQSDNSLITSLGMAI